MKESYYKQLNVTCQDGEGKVVPALNLAPSHADVCGNEGVAPYPYPVTKNIKMTLH
jgi:hypothetical protein